VPLPDQAAPPAAFRDAAPTELDAIGTLLRGAYARYERDMPAELYAQYVAGLPPDADDLTRTIVAVAGDELVGTARLYAPGASGIGLPADAAWVRAVAVGAGAEGTGLGRRIMAECHRRARAMGARSVVLHTTTFMVRAVRLYEGLGYVRVPAWDVRAEHHYPLAQPTDVTAIAYRYTLA
jgi:GNAT superfamily N-acetyltransferase